MARRPTWPVASGTLVLGFAVAQATGVRALGGVVLVAGAAWCARRWRENAGDRRALELLGVFLVLFVASHLLALAIGPWPSVLIVAAVMGLATRAGADAPSPLRPAHHPG